MQTKTGHCWANRVVQQYNLESLSLPGYLFFNLLGCSLQVTSELRGGDGHFDTANHGPGFHPELHPTLAGPCCRLEVDLC